MKPTAFALRCLIASCLFFAWTYSRANSYSCRDAAGSPLLQSSTDGCASDICEIKDSGAKICEETKEQRKERETAENLDADCRAKRREGMLKDFGFLDKFPKREDIDIKRDKALANNNQYLIAAKGRRDAIREKLARFRTEAEFYGPNHPIPGELKADIEFNAKRLVELEADVTNAEAATKQINSDSDGLLKRYDKLMKHEFDPVPCESK